MRSRANQNMCALYYTLVICIRRPSARVTLGRPTPKATIKSSNTVMLGSTLTATLSLSTIFQASNAEHLRTHSQPSYVSLQLCSTTSLCKGGTPFPEARRRSRVVASRNSLRSGRPRAELHHALHAASGCRFHRQSQHGEEHPREKHP